MNKEIDCNIIGDLLPSYLSNITSFNTNKIIEEHINRCSKCEKKLAYMKRDISLNNIKESIDDLKINYFKKIHKKFFYILLISILIMIISFMASVFLLEKNTDEAIFKYIESWYNRKRLHSSINYMTPDQCELMARSAA